MKNGQLVEVDIHPTDVSIVISPEPHSGGPVLMGRMDRSLVVGYQRICENQLREIEPHSRREVTLNRATGQASMNVLGEVVDLLVDNRIKFGAFENVLREINPLLHERYLGEIEVVKERKASALRPALTASLK